MRHRIYILAEAGTRETIFRRVDDAIDALRVEFEEPFHYLGGEDKADYLHVETWQQSSGVARIRLVDDVQIPGRWLSIDAPSRADCDALAAGVGDIVELASLEHLWADVNGTPQPRGSLTRLALALNRELDPKFLQLLETALRDGSKEERLEACLCAVLLKWPELLVSLRAAAAKETDPEVQRVLAHATNECSRSNESNGD
jgi:hypothetical protein